MFEKDLRIALLLDYYGEVLDGHTRDVMQSYYDDDLSLAEVAEGEGISRQGVLHIVRKGQKELLFLEEKLGVAKRSRELEAVGKTLLEVAERLRSSPDGDARICAGTLTEAAGLINNKL